MDNIDATKPNRDTNLFYLVAKYIIELRRPGELAKLPSLLVAEIEDKSKDDAFIKFTAITQILWITIQVIMRGSRGLSISQLEIAEVAFSQYMRLQYTHFNGRSRGG